MAQKCFEWDLSKEKENILKHGVSFEEAQYAFFDSSRVIAEDTRHSDNEKRYFCFGSNYDGSGILTVRFTYRNESVRIFGAGYWRRGKRIYEQANQIL